MAWECAQHPLAWMMAGTTGPECEDSSAPERYLSLLDRRARFRFSFASSFFVRLLWWIFCLWLRFFIWFSPQLKSGFGSMHEKRPLPRQIQSSKLKTV